MFGRRKEYSLSTMTFDELGKMIYRYVGKSRSKITILHVRDEIFVVRTTVEKVDRLNKECRVSFAREDGVEIFSLTININNGLVLIDYITNDKKSDTCCAAWNNFCRCDLRCFNYMNCEFDNTKLLEEYLFELVDDKVDRHNNNVKYAMIFTAMISVLGYCTMKVVRYIRADKIDRRAMLKSTLVPACILAGFTATTDTFRSILAIPAQVVKVINKMITKLTSVKKG